MKRILITKKELKIITNAVRQQKILSKNDIKKHQEFQNLTDKFDKLSFYFEYSMIPINYDEF